MPESEINLLIDFEGRKLFLDLAGLKLDVEERPRRNNDALTNKSLHSLQKERIIVNWKSSNEKGPQIFLNHILESIRIFEN